MNLDMGMLAIFVTILVTLLGAAVAWGALSQRVTNQGRTIEANRRSFEHDMERLHTENREDHRQIFGKLEEINKFIQSKS